MHLIRRSKMCRLLINGAVTTIGNYDGVHRGHQAIFKEMVDAARQRELRTCVVTFEPMPAEFFHAAESPGRLSTWQERYRLIKRAGIDVLCLLPFDQNLANTEPQDFVRDYLVGRTNTRILYIGDDFRFGRARQGDTALLRKMGKVYEFSIRQVPTVVYEGQRISSSSIRRLLIDGDLDRAASLLGRRYAMCGRVVHGQKLGRTLGFPTANIRPHRDRLPMSGVFVVKVNIRGEDRWREGVANLGCRPAIGGTEALLEVFLFEFDEDLYGAHLTVEFIRRLRDEAHFDHLDAMVEQMHKDVANARRILAQIEL